MVKNKPFFILITIWLFLSITTLFAETKRIMPLGDSITNGATDGSNPISKRMGYRAPLYRQLIDANYSVDFVGSLQTGNSVKPSFDTDNEGHPDWTSFDLSEKIFGFLSNTQPDIILLHAGTNDRTKSINGIEDLLDEIDRYENKSGKKIRIIIAEIINRRDNDLVITAFNKRLNTLVMDRWQHGDILTLVDMDTKAALQKSDYATNTHPNNNGYAKMARVWFNALLTPYVPISTGPFPKDDKVDAQTGTTVSINVLANDKDYQNDMDISSIRFVGGSNSLTISGQGTWRANKDGIVTFKPKGSFTSDPTPVQYTVKDKEGTESKPSTITINYSNASLETFPTSVVPKSFIDSVSIDESTNSVTFITRVPNTGIRF
jgi:hypothetical protein